jgi:hypothetical protein
MRKYEKKLLPSKKKLVEIPAAMKKETIEKTSRVRVRKSAKPVKMGVGGLAATTITMPVEVKDAALVRAAETQRSFSGYVRLLILRDLREVQGTAEMAV